ANDPGRRRFLVACGPPPYDRSWVPSNRLALPPDQEDRGMRSLFAMFGGFRVGLIALAALVVLYSSTTIVPAGHVGVQDFFGRVSDRILAPGINLIAPGTHVVKFSVQTRELKEAAAVPTSEGLIVNLDVSLLFRLQPEAAARVYKTIGRRVGGVVIDPQLRSILRAGTAD